MKTDHHSRRRRTIGERFFCVLAIISSSLDQSHAWIIATSVKSRHYDQSPPPKRHQQPTTRTFASTTASTTATTAVQAFSIQNKLIRPNKRGEEEKENILHVHTSHKNVSSLSSSSASLYKLQGKLLKQIRTTCQNYDMLQDGDHIMVCVSGGKDSATLLYLLKHLQRTLPIRFDMTAVHVDQGQPGYNGTALEAWLRDDLKVPFEIVQDNTYAVVLDKTAPGQSYCALCSRLRRGVLYTAATRLGCNKMALGHHADDALETLLLNMVHAGQLKAMPARYQTRGRMPSSNEGTETSSASLAVLRPLILCFENDIAEYAQLQRFPILPCNLCSNQSALQRPQVKLLLKTLQTLNPNAKKNLLHALQTVKPSHLLDQDLRRACGMDPVTGDHEDGDGVL